MALLVLAVGASSILRAPPTYALRLRTVPTMRVSAADEQRMLYSETALSAFISAEMRHFCESKMAELGHDENITAKMLNRDNCSATLRSRRTLR